MILGLRCPQEPTHCFVGTPIFSPAIEEGKFKDKRPLLAPPPHSPVLPWKFGWIAPDQSHHYSIWVTLT